jgi:hypothetical protein
VIGEGRGRGSAAVSLKDKGRAGRRRQHATRRAVLQRALVPILLDFVWGP